MRFPPKLKKKQSSNLEKKTFSLIQKSISEGFTNNSTKMLPIYALLSYKYFIQLSIVDFVWETNNFDWQLEIVFMAISIRIQLLQILE